MEAVRGWVWIFSGIAHYRHIHTADKLQVSQKLMLYDYDKDI